LIRRSQRAVPTRLPDFQFFEHATTANLYLVQDQDAKSGPFIAFGSKSSMTGEMACEQQKFSLLPNVLIFP